MTASRTLPLIVATLLTAGLLAGCQQPSTSDVNQSEEGVIRLGSVEAVDSVSRTMAPNDRPLVIDGFRGTVGLTGADQETAELTFVRRGRAKDTESARGVLEDVSITESGTEEAYTYTLKSDGGAYAVVDVSGTVPRNGPLRVKGVNGAVTIADVRGEVTVTHDHGPVTVRDAGSSVDVQTKNGDLEVDLQSVPADATVELSAKNGDVTLRLPPATAAQLSAQTSAGVVRTMGLTLRDEQFMPRDAGGEYTAQLGAGSASIDLRTENGSILIQAADTTVEATPEEGTPLVPPSDTTITAPSEPDTSMAAPEPDTTAAPEPDTTVVPDTTEQS